MSLFVKNLWVYMNFIVKMMKIKRNEGRRRRKEQ